MATGAKIGYVRVSTNSQSCEPQLTLLKQHGCDRIFSDDGISGMNTKRDGLNTALETLKAGDTLIVWKLDRLARSLGYLCTLLDDFTERDIGFISLSDGINTTTHSGKLICQILGAIAEFERSIIIERTVLGIDNARRQGKKFGRPYKLTESDLKSAHYMIYKDGMDIKSVADTFKVSVLTLRRGFRRCALG
ncbi:MAG: recombinase family protein [Pseudomonadota bacterium]